MSTVEDGTRHLRWPSERFYWTVVDAVRLPAGEKPTIERLRFIAEPDLPEPLEDLHVVFSRANDGKFVGCALPRRLLESEVPADVLTLIPVALPDLVGGRVEPRSLNLLTEQFEPRSIRRSRRLATVAAFAVATLAFLAVILGIERRILTARDDVARLRGEREALVSAALGAAPAGQPLPPDLRLAVELRSIRQTRRQGTQLPVVVDATDALVDLLKRWPPDLAARAEAVVVTDSSIHVRGLVGESEQAQNLASATSGLDGFQASFPSVESGPEGCRFALEWRREVGAKR